MMRNKKDIFGSPVLHFDTSLSKQSRVRSHAFTHAYKGDNGTRARKKPANIR